MLAWLLLFGLHQAVARDLTQHSQPVTRYITSCPAAGYFVQRDAAPNTVGPGDCFLCFCQEDDSAVCWRRDSRRCDFKYYHNVGKRDARVRRSPLSFSEVFVRDAAREFFNKQSPEQCKPFESSFSDGCPPADWCIGCTVCDCDANGRWDCHVLSFCPDKNGKKQMKKQRPRGGPLRNRVAKRQAKSSKRNAAQLTKNTRNYTKKPTRKPQIKANVRKHSGKQSAPVSKHKINPVKATHVKKFASIKKPQRKLQEKKAAPSRNKINAKNSLVINKNLPSNKNLNIKSTEGKANKNRTVEVAQKVIQQFMTTMQKMMKNIELKNTNNLEKGTKVVKKRSMPKQDTMLPKKAVKKPKFIPKPSTAKVNKNGPRNKNAPKLRNSKSVRHNRNKRQVVNENILNITGTTNDIYTVKEQTSRASIFSNKYKGPSLNLSLELNNKLTENRTERSDSTNQEIYKSHDNINDENKEVIVKYEIINDSINNVTNTYYKYTTTSNSTNSSSVIRPFKYSKNFDFNNRSYFDDNINSKSNVRDIIISSNESNILPHNFTQGSNQNERIQNLTKTKSDDVTLTMNKNYTDYIFTQKIGHNWKNMDQCCEVQTFVKKMIGANNNTYKYSKTAKSVKKPKRYTILNKIKRLIKKIFNKKEKSKSFYNKVSYDENHHSHSENDKKCILDHKESNKLHEMVNELKTECKNIFKTVGIIKGLLQMLEINDNKTQMNGKSYDPHGNINKLSSIISDTYAVGGNPINLTSHQRNQINYIKDNFSEFIKSIGKFAKILDDVIQIMIYHRKKQNIMRTNGKNNNYQFETNNLANVYKMSIKQKLENLKKLISKYNLLHNNFVKKIYLVLNNIETESGKKNRSRLMVRGNEYKEINKTYTIEENFTNIIGNIRRLRILAEKLNTLNRRKRAAVEDDDVLEYFLILMEYLLKRHMPKHNRPVTDGLDLLIEAIRSAPENKLIRKKLLNITTEKPLVTRTITSKRLFNEEINYSNSNTIQKEEHNLNFIQNKETQMKKNISILVNEHDDDEEKIEEIYQKFKSIKDSSSEQTPDENSLSTSVVSSTFKSYYNSGDAISNRKSKTEYNNVSKNETDYDSFEALTYTTSKSVDTILENSSEKPIIGKLTPYSNNRQAKTNASVNDFLVDAKANIDWIEENFREHKPLIQVEVKPSTPKPEAPTRTHKPSGKNKARLTDILNGSDLVKKKNNRKSSSEEVMSKKQMDLLNSLDYVAEKDAQDESDSKEDKFLSDSY